MGVMEVAQGDLCEDSIDVSVLYHLYLLPTKEKAFLSVKTRKNLCFSKHSLDQSGKSATYTKNKTFPLKIY